ncbi:MAG: GMC family oxidoreductase N-terminal domain-containing protein [Gammaproteobacteria bacterium]|nr:GMC family oxidoreductase N-terminal domain-containing protein [Gammaproteobacteria bacterium]
MADYLIVGAGPAGCVLASRLTEDPSVSVLVLEAGGHDWHPYIHMPAGFAKLTGERGNWGWSTVPQSGVGERAFWYPQGKVVGGGSSINAQIYTRGNRADYDAWADEAGCHGWSYRDVLPYFRRAEDNDSYHDTYHASDGPLGVSFPVNPLPISRVYLRAGQQAGIPFNADFNGAQQAGVGFYQLTQRDARRCSAAVAYLRPALRRPNLDLKTGGLVTRILLDGQRAVGVEWAPRPGRAVTRVHCDREVLVTAGAIGSPKLLLQSGIGPAEELRALGISVNHDLPAVGRNLQDHMDVYVVNELNASHSYDSYTKWHKAAWAGLQYVLFRRGPVASNLIDAGGFWYADPQARSPDIQFHFVLGSGLEHGLEKLRNDGITLNSAFLRPRSRGSVRLRSSDPTAAPLIDPNYWGDPYDREMSIRGFKLARKIMAQQAFAPYLKAERLPGPDCRSDADIENYATRHAKTDYHPVGTCKMGTDSGAVVDLSLKVCGLDGLRVCDSSVMPLLTSCNTNAPTIMVAEKAADHVRGAGLLPAAELDERAAKAARAVDDHAA